MATSIQYFSFSFTITDNPTMRKAHAKPTFKICKFSQKPIDDTPSLKEICKQGNLKEAFLSFSSLFSDPNQLRFCPDEVYSSVLELCASKRALPQGQQIHAHLITSNAMHDSVFLNTKLVFMYGKCGSLRDAQNLFDKMPHRTIFTWNAILGAYVTNGEPSGALELYRDMRISDVPLDACTFPCILKACGGLKDLRCGAEVHGLAVKNGCISVAFVINSLVAMYAKCNDLNGARQLFDIITEKEDTVPWNSIISAYSANEQPTEALELFRKMRKANLDANTYTLVAALQACVGPAFRKLGMEIHAAILKSGHYLDIYVANALVVMYTRCGRMAEAVIIFHKMDEKDNVSWNSILSGFVQNSLYSEALQFFHAMQNASQKPDQISVLSTAAASGRLGYLLNGKEVHAHAIKNGFDTDLQVGNTLLDMYAKCCCENYMIRIFNKMPTKDFISWTTIIAGYTQKNSHLRALELFREVQMLGVDVDEMMIGSILLACSGLKCISCVKEIHGYIMRRGLSDLVLKNSIMDVYGECRDVDYASRMFQLIEIKDVVSWTSMISCYVHNGLANEALEHFYLMKESGVEPDSIALVSVLSAAASLSALRKGKGIHGFLIRKGYSLEGPIASSLLDMYARCGAFENSCKVFTCVRDKDLVLWTSMINANGMHGRGMAAIHLFRMMVDQNLVPDHITFLALLYACSHSGLINEGRKFLEIMKSEYQLEPWPEHYACLVDLLARTNHLEEAYKFVKTMQIEATAVVWSALLSACHVHSNKELGEIAAQKLLELDPKNPGNYVLISNIFAATGRWKDVEDVRMRMKGKGLKKNPGCSWIELGNKAHTFMAMDKSHPEFYEIHQKLTLVTEKLQKEGGYVAQIKFVLHDIKEEEKIKMLYGHSERLAIAYGLLRTPKGTPIRITKNLRVCGDCHTFCRLVSKFFGREIIVRDANRFHHFESGVCSCGDFW
ncbi:pentatricopeptide repeat-containing protein At3g63370, chloroplastic [Malania oleifera]|uniref:pentatricopeptide repeat-containing protein At3g63370, chloroplastic n=1 Tax=Malania oleifera TaxID=397392 RepID=UPI0025AE9DEA|nr:pentatricopeptide repeat-containing protein At3g63370, chloroplastic [Malania oleifera]XP_057964128.1 pentatricopeptide repeat-containing protein At3g63370, chloroplastic [Malania oleifera]